jgi:hypothetical protein
MQPARIQGRGEERGPAANIGADDMRVLEPECVGDANDGLAHRPQGQQRIAALGMTDPGKSIATRCVCSPTSRDHIGS